LRACRVVCQGVAADPGWLNRVSRLVVGSLICCSLLVGRFDDEVVDTGPYKSAAVIASVMT
jgi:hypothetical protein